MVNSARCPILLLLVLGEYHRRCCPLGSQLRLQLLMVMVVVIAVGSPYSGTLLEEQAEAAALQVK